MAEYKLLSKDGLTHLWGKILEEFRRREPVVLWETDGTTGLLGLNKDWVADDGWQVTGLDMTPFKRVKFYVKPNRDSLSKNRLTPPAVCEVFLDNRHTSDYAGGEFIGTYLGASPADHNVLYSCIFVVSADKTKFKFQTQNSLYGTTKGGRNDNGRFCYLCEGYYY